MTPVRDANGWARWDFLDLIRAAVLAKFRPEDYLAAACSSGRLRGLPLAPAACRALGLSDAEDLPAGNLLRRDAAYLVAWAERAGVDEWTASGMLVAAITPAKLPWSSDPEHVLISRERWPEGYERFREFDFFGKGWICVRDLHPIERSDALEVALRGLRAARESALGRALEPIAQA